MTAQAHHVGQGHGTPCAELVFIGAAAAQASTSWTRSPPWAKVTASGTVLVTDLLPESHARADHQLDDPPRLSGTAE
ncbi:hypothetical protein [Streptomyces sp. NPDC059861]|uniref:hypothetical protein n=1 Tax=Streptomyces sp. NPDC059861 TaxID=3346974 RepID=UPI00365D6EB5